MDFGSAVGRARGVAERKLAELHHWRDSDAYTPVERLVLEYADNLSRTPAVHDAQLLGQLREHFRQRQLIELTTVIAWEHERARFNRGFGVEAQGYSEGAVCVLPARFE